MQSNTIVKQITPPLNKNAIWVDITDRDNPVIKVYNNGWTALDNKVLKDILTDITDVADNVDKISTAVQNVEKEVDKIPLTKSANTGSIVQTDGDNKVTGTYGFASGKGCTAGNYAFSRGLHCEAIASGSSALGYYADAHGIRSFSCGNNTKTTNEAEAAFGICNNSLSKLTTSITNGGTLFSVGIGKTTERRNAIEILGNGNIYIYGLGGYDGSNPRATGVKSLQELLK